MNNRNSIDARNFVNALLSGLRLAFYLSVLALILGTIFFVQYEKPKENLRVPYNPLYKNTECKDWQSDSTMTQGKIETLNEILAKMKQSSIEKLHEESSELIHKHLKGELSARDLIVMHHNLYYDVKEMHKQEIIEATKYGNSFEQGDLRCETYYKNTYEKEN